MRAGRIELLKEGEGAFGDGTIEFAGSGRESGKELAGSFEGVEVAVLVEDEVGSEREEGRADVGEEFLAVGIEMFGGWGEEDEFLAKPGDEFGDDGMEEAALRLDGEDDGDGVTGPGTDLMGLVDFEIGELVIEVEGVAERASEFGPVEGPEFDVGTGEGELVVRAVGRIATAQREEIWMLGAGYWMLDAGWMLDGGGGRLVAGCGGLVDDFVGAGAEAAWVTFGEAGLFLEEGGFEEIELTIHETTPVGGDGSEAEGLFEGGPDVGDG